MQASAIQRPALSTPAKAFRRDIEGLRAIAVGGVVAFHFGFPGITGGFTGVDIFFVISGYLITWLLLQELEQTGDIRFLRFYGRRARRLLPAALLMTLATLAAMTYVLAPAEQQHWAMSAGATSLYVSNFWYLRSAASYFGPESTANPFLHTWSLAVEEQFYLVWPALLLFAARRRFRPARLATAMACVTLMSFALCVWLTNRDPVWAFYASPARAWEFGLGGLAAFSAVSHWATRWKTSSVLGWLGGAAILLSFLVIPEQSRFPGAIALLPVAGTVCVLISGANGAGRGFGKLLGTPVFQWFGRRSYSIYLWHWPVLVLALAVDPHLASAGRLGCGALAVLCAAASYRWVENPIRNSARLATPAMRSLALGLSLTVLGCVAATGIYAFGKHFADSPAQRRLVLPSDAYPTSRAGCQAPYLTAKPVQCVFGAASSSTTVVLFGDSHAAEWSAPLVAIAQAKRWRLVTYLKSGCSVADIPVYNPVLHRMYDECASWRKQAIQDIVQLRPNLIVMGEYSNIYIGGRRSNSGGKVTLGDWEAGLKRSLLELLRGSRSIVLLKDTPTPDRDIPVCLQRAVWRGTPAICDLPRSAVNGWIGQSESQLASQIPGVHYLDLTSQFCGATSCPAIRSGVVVYLDRSHMANRYALTLEAPLQAGLLASIPR